MVKANKQFLFIILTMVVIGVVYCFFTPNFPSSHINLEKVPSEIAIHATDLVTAFSTNEKTSNTKYVGKIIEVTGFVQEITFLNNRNSVLLRTKNEQFGIICDLHNSQIEKVKKIAIHQKIKVKGICKGFLNDVILLNCTLDLNPKESE